MKLTSWVGIVIVMGFFIGFGSGLVENNLGFANGPQNTYYGFPLAWRAVNIKTGQKYGYPFELLFDVLFGMVMVSIVAVAFWATERHIMKNDKPVKRK